MFGLEDDLVDEIDSLKRRLRKITKERNEYKKLAESWMKDYDKLKQKYEPSEIVLSDE